MRAEHPTLKPTVEVLHASDGRVYLLKSGAPTDFLLREPPIWISEFLNSLDGRSRGELAASVRSKSPDAPSHALALLDAMEEAGLIEEHPGRLAKHVSTDSRLRYANQIAYLAEMGADGGRQFAAQARIEAGTVVIVGLGGTGTWTAVNLAEMGVGCVRGVDDDVVTVGNLSRQILYGDEDLGQPKVTVAIDRLRKINAFVRYEGIRRQIDGEEAAREVIDGADFVVVTADEPPYDLARWINGACVRLGVPHVGASLMPPFAVIGPLVIPGQTACIACHEAAMQEEIPAYQDLVAQSGNTPARSTPIAPACGVVGSFVALQVMHFLAGLSLAATAGATLTLDLRTLRSEQVSVERNPTCAVCAPT